MNGIAWIYIKKLSYSLVGVECGLAELSIHRIGHVEFKIGPILEEHLAHLVRLALGLKHLRKKQSLNWISSIIPKQSNEEQNHQMFCLHFMKGKYVFDIGKYKLSLLLDLLGAV